MIGSSTCRPNAEEADFREKVRRRSSVNDDDDDADDDTDADVDTDADTVAIPDNRQSPSPSSRSPSARRTRRGAPTPFAQANDFLTVFRGLVRCGRWGFPVRLTYNIETGKYEKKPLVRWKPFQHRYPSAAQVMEWVSHFPNCAVGLPTGRGLALFVVDADSSRAHRWLLRRGEIKTWTVKTRRGWHYYFRYPTFSVRNSVSELARGIDVRGDGGFVVAAGSFYGAATYSWVEGRSPADVELADAPSWLLEKLKRRGERKARKPAGPSVAATAPQPHRGVTSAWARAAYVGGIERLRVAPIGTRHNTFLSVARRLGQLCAGGELDQVEVLRALHYIADHWPSTENSYKAIEWGFTHGLETPRRAPGGGWSRASS